MQFGKRVLATAVAAAAASLLGWGTPSVRAADHGDAPNVARDASGDLGDTFVFLDPNDNTKLVISVTLQGFIPAGEAVNFHVFDHTLSYRFDFENTGDAKPDQSIEVTFAPKGAAAAEPQTATVTLSGKPKRSFTAPTTVATLAATALDPTVTTDAATGIAFFAGEVDDPFFFDIPAFGRFAASVRAGTPDPTQLQRGRDTFAGYNNQAIALSVPVSLVRGASSNNVIGVNTIALRKTVKIGKDGVIKAAGKGKQIDRSSTPGVNAVLIPYARKNEHNAATTLDDAAGKFADDLVATLTAFGANPQSIATLAGIVVTNGDFVRVDVTKPNTGTGGGTNPEAAFPNGRRLGDDTIDTILTVIANGSDLGDSVDANEVPLRDTFPFYAAPHQPLATGVTDDLTRN
jgi:hypothetical protein